MFVVRGGGSRARRRSAGFRSVGAPSARAVKAARPHVLHAAPSATAAGTTGIAAPPSAHAKRWSLLDGEISFRAIDAGTQRAPRRARKNSATHVPPAARSTNARVAMFPGIAMLGRVGSIDTGRSATAFLGIPAQLSPQGVSDCMLMIQVPPLHAADTSSHFTASQYEQPPVVQHAPPSSGGVGGHAQCASASFAASASALSVIGASAPASPSYAAS